MVHSLGSKKESFSCQSSLDRHKVCRGIYKVERRAYNSDFLNARSRSGTVGGPGATSIEGTR